MNPLEEVLKEYLDANLYDDYKVVMEELLQAYLDANGYDDYRVVIEMPEHGIDNTEHDPKKAELMKELSDMVTDMWEDESV